MRSATRVAVLAVLAACASRSMPTVEDRTPPAVRVVSPAAGARVGTATPTIEIGYDDGGSGIQVVSFKALINGRDYSAEFDHHSQGATGSISAARRLRLGENVVAVEVTDRAGNRANVESSFINAGGGWLDVVVDASAEPRRNVELILDASGSMEEALGMATRMEVARRAVRDLVESVPEGTPLGLRVFRGCDGIAPLVPIRPLDRRAYMARVDSIKPTGGTPIVASLLESFEALGRTRDGQRIAVLVTDGGESCSGELDQVVAAAKDAATRLIVIGFDIKDAGITDQLRTLAESTGGALYVAGDQASLSEALRRSVLRLGYAVLDSAGIAVVEADVGGDRIELPPGTYRLHLRTTPATTVADIRIGELTETTVELRRSSSGIDARVRGPVASGRSLNQH